MQNRYSLVETIRRIVQQEMQSTPGNATGGGNSGNSGNSNNGGRNAGGAGGNAGTATQGGARRGLLKRTDGSSGRKGAQSGAAMGQIQSELSEELTQNLQKLKQVIGESQQIARKIETALGKGGQNG